MKKSPKKKVATPTTLATSASPATPATPKVAKKEEVKEPAAIVYEKVDDEVMISNNPPTTYGIEDYNKKLAERLSVFPSRKHTKPDGSNFIWAMRSFFDLPHLKNNKPPTGRDLYVDPMSM